MLWNVELEIGLGATVPVFLATVPMLFLLPTESVPLICLVAALAQESRTRAGFMRRALGTTWSHICLLGPVAVLLLTGSEVANWGDWYIYIAALASFVFLDIAMTMIQMRVVLHKPIGYRDFAVGPAADLVFALMAFLGVVATPGFRYAFAIPMLLALASAALTRERRARSTRRPSSRTPTAARRCCSAASSTPTTGTPATTAAASSSSRSRSPTSSISATARAS